MKMDDLISRQAAIGVVNEERCQHGFIKDILFDKVLISLMNKIRVVPSAHQGGDGAKWTPCDEKLPDKRGYYLTSWGGHYVGITEWTGKGWLRTSITDGHITERPKIDAWMERPEPYRK